ncbi:GNAT family N-acetyltransferase [Stella sp.]|uniref:bifunctional acetate--CoA ligase family protein/GNAT family N-acetyltransferase n=1 Tax=Stella sp. TaxID=2912054 RepID=UPI0035B21CD5
MTVRNLDRLLAPASVALIGASTQPNSVGQVTARNLLQGGFKGPILPVNPRHTAIEGVLAYPSVAALPIAPDLAVIATPPDTVPGLIAELGQRGTRAAVVLTAGFGEGGAEAGERRRQAMLDAARPHLLRVLGPNCVGLLVPGIGLNASFAHVGAKPGDLAFLTQSGAIVTALLDWAASRGIGFSHLVSMGGMADVDFGDLLDQLGQDPGVRAILLYVEGVTSPRKFMSAARAAARTKPVLVVKSGRRAEGAKAARSHTGALAGSDAVYDAAFRRAGMLRVHDTAELFDAVETLALVASRFGSNLPGERLAILTNGGGPGVLATDALVDRGGALADLAPETLARLDAALPPTWSHGNPVDIIGDAPADRYRTALDALLADPNADAILVLNCPTAIADPTEAAQAVIETIDDRRRLVLTNWLGAGAAAPGRALFARAGIPTYETPDQAVRAFMHLVQYRRNQELLRRVPRLVGGGGRPDRAAARAPIEAALAEGRDWLSEVEAKAVMRAYGIPIVPTEVAATPDEAAATAGRLGLPAALKILSPDITHKTDVGGVALDLADPAAVKAAAERMLRTVARHAPDARIAGFTVQPMVARPGAFELILGIVDDRTFGPVLLFGQGGVAVEVLDDKALGLPPLDEVLAREMIGRTRVSRLLAGFRGRPPADVDGIVHALVRLSELAADHPEIVEVDINPLLADADGVIALDARIRVARAERPGTSRFAIRPYPQELEDTDALQDGTPIRLRPIRPEDAPALEAIIARMTPEDLRMRFFAPMRRLPEVLLARLTQIDYDREMALVAFAEGPAGEPDGLGVVRLLADPDGQQAEFAIGVRSDVKGRGLGWLLMRRIIDYARQRGIGAVVGDVLRENQPMLDLARDLGFRVETGAADPGIVRVRLDLAG